MSAALAVKDMPANIHDLARGAVVAVDAVLADATDAVRALVTENGRISNAAIEREQRATHGLAWLATYVESVRQLASYAERLSETGTFGELEDLIVRIGLGEYLSQILGGIPMNQGEVVRPVDVGLSVSDVARRFAGAADTLIATGNTAANRARLAVLVQEQESSGHFGDPALDETLIAIRDEMRKFSVAEVLPHAHEWHLENAYIPLDVVAKLAELGVFGLTLPESYGGMGLGKESMCVVSEELSRGYIGVGRSAPARRSPAS